MAIFRMARPMRRKGSRHEQFRQWIPADVLDQARGKTLVVEVGGYRIAKRIGPRAVEITLSLRTSDRHEVKQRHSAVMGQCETFFAGLRQQVQPIPLTHEACVRLAGDFYRGWTGVEPDLGLLEDARGQPLDAETMEAIWRSAAEKLAMDMPEASTGGLRRMVEGHLLRKGFAVDTASLSRVCEYAIRAIRESFEVQERRASGDYGGPDPVSKYGQPLTKLATTGTAGATKLKGKRQSFVDLIEIWRIDPQKSPKPSTVASYAKAFERLAEAIGHDDPQRLTHEEVQRFKRERLQRPNVSPQTVRDVDIAGVRSVLNWAIEEGHLMGPSPALGVKVTVPKGQKSRKRAYRNHPDAGKGLTDTEALGVLELALCYERKNRVEKAKTAAAKKWVPWLLAYSGARAGEWAQLRKEDVQLHERGFWFIVFDPDAGTIKTDEPRYVPLHSHLVELGFIEFVKASAQGHLFLDPRPGGQPAARPVLELQPGHEDRWSRKKKNTRKNTYSRTDDPRGILGPLRGIENRLAEFSRTVVTDSTVDPLHGWRHRFKTWAMARGLSERMVDEIQGHARSGTSRSYGGFTIVEKREAIERLPRYEVGALANSSASTGSRSPTCMRG